MLDVHKIALFKKINYGEDARLRRISQKKQNIQKKNKQIFNSSNLPFAGEQFKK